MGHIFKWKCDLFWFEREKYFYREINHIHLFQMLCLLDDSPYHIAKRKEVTERQRIAFTTGVVNWLVV